MVRFRQGLIRPAGALVPRLGAVAHELFNHPGCFNGVFVLPDPDGEAACRSELSIGVAVATGDAAELSNATSWC